VIRISVQPLSPPYSAHSSDSLVGMVQLSGIA
jgi:hypothetical protein